MIVHFHERPWRAARDHRFRGRPTSTVGWKLENHAQAVLVSLHELFERLERGPAVFGLRELPNMISVTGHRRP